MDIPHTRGLLGHSDADVALHALADAILGALAMRDIGYHFPDTDPRWKGADSRMLLREVAAMAAAQGYRPSNVDITVMAQEPRLLPHIPAMQACVAADLGLEPGRVSIKATTTERLGFTGRAEAHSSPGHSPAHTRRLTTAHPLRDAKSHGLRPLMRPLPVA